MNLFFIICIGFLGALLGSFIGVISERIFTGQSWARGRSRCNSCRHDLTAFDLIPVLSWLASRGRCRHCGSVVPGAYALYELSLGIAFALAFVHFGIGLPLALFLLALCILTFTVIYDLRHTIVPPLASALLIFISLLFAVSTSVNTHELLMIVLRAFFIALFFFSLYFFSRGRAMGLGDTPVAFALSLLAGNAAIAGVLFSFWIGAVIGIMVLVLRKGGPTMGIEVPFVPFLALGYLLAIFTQWNPLPF